MVSEGYTRWSGRDTRGASSSGQMDKSEAWRGTKEYETEKEKEKKEEKEKSLNIMKEDLWGPAEDFDQEEGEPRCDLQKEHGG